MSSEHHGSANAQLLAVVVLSFVHSAILVVASIRNAPVHDEVAHLAATVHIAERGEFDLYRVNPPLVKYAVALPLIWSDCDKSLGAYRQNPGERRSWQLGARFFDANGEAAFALLRQARWACIPFSLVGLALCVKWACELYSFSSGIVAGVLWTFSPTVLGNAALITPDVASASFGLLAAYGFWKFLERPDWARALLAGVALGLAELAKMTWVIAFAVWPLTAFVCWRKLRHRDGYVGGRTFAVRTGSVLVIALYCLNLGYGFEGSFTRLGDYQFVSQTLTGGGRMEFYGTGGNRFSGTVLGKVPMPVPRNWLMGIDVQKVDFESPHSAYAAGTWKDGGWPWYYCYCLLVKEPVTTVLLIAAGLFAAGISIRSLQCGEVVMLSASLAALLVVSSQTNLNRHYRYILPSLGFLFVLTGRLIGRIHIRNRGVWAAVLSLLIVIESLTAFPYFGAFFNVAVGGPSKGRNCLAHSAVDWGQGLFALRDWVRENPRARPLHIAWAGYVTPDDLGIEHSYFPKRTESAMDRPVVPGWYIINLGTLHQANSAYRWIDRLSPAEIVALNVYIYHISEDDIQSLDVSIATE